MKLDVKRQITKPFNRELFWELPCQRQIERLMMRAGDVVISSYYCYLWYSVVGGNAIVENILHLTICLVWGHNNYGYLGCTNSLGLRIRRR